MANLDVTEVLADPDFMDAMTCARKTQTVGGDGRVSETSEDIVFFGVVTSESGDVLNRESFADRVSGSITIHSTFLLNGNGETHSADIVAWQGRHYTVRTVNDYSHFGSGFVSAGCDLIEVAG